MGLSTTVPVTLIADSTSSPPRRLRVQAGSVATGATTGPEGTTVAVNTSPSVPTAHAYHGGNGAAWSYTGRPAR